MTSRPLVAAALLALLVLGLAPIAVMLARVGGGDLAALVSARALSLLGRTLLLGFGAAGVAVVLGVPYGFLAARTDVPGAAALRVLGPVPLLLPPLLLAMTWTVVAPGLRGAPAAILVLGLSTFPLVAVFTARAFERIDAGLEEAALLAGGLPAVLRMEAPLVAPAALAGAALAFAFSVNDFGVPDYVSSVGPKFNVYADEIHLSWSQVQRPGLAVATALPLVLVTLAALLPALALRRRGAMTSLGEGFRAPERLRLRRLRLPALALLLGILACGVAFPLGRLLWEAAAMPRHLRAAEGLLAALPAGWETAREAFGLAVERARADLARSLRYSAGAALLAAPVGLVLGHAIERARSRAAGRALELAALLPFAVPAILFGIGIVATWNTAATAGLYESGWMAVLAFAGRFVVFPVLVLSGAVAALHPSLEEAAAVAGARPARRVLAVVAPLARGALAASFVLVFVFAMRDLDSAIMVPAANKTAIFRVYNGVHFGRDSYVAALSLLLVFAILLPGTLWAIFARRRLEVLP